MRKEIMRGTALELVLLNPPESRVQRGRVQQQRGGDILTKRLLMVLLILAGTARISHAGVRWMGETEGKKVLGGWVKDVTGPPGMGYWAGEVTEIEIDENEQGFTLTGRAKVRITWITDRTSYQCHEIYIVRADEVEDFTHRSLMLRECS
jgi:hypothetical protein